MQPWTCPACQTVNQSNFAVCYQCHQARPARKGLGIAVCGLLVVAGGWVSYLSGGADLFGGWGFLIGGLLFVAGLILAACGK